MNFNCTAQNKLDRENGKKESCIGKIQELEKTLSIFDKRISGNNEDPPLENYLGI